jgi:outer membrane receptor protein involved in Fe transport
MSSEPSPSLCKSVPAFVLGTLLVLGTPTVALAHGTVMGAILNGLTGQPIRGATVEVEQGDARSQSDIDGVFRVHLTPGSYSLIVRKDGFQSQRVTDVHLAEGAVENVSMVLMPSEDAPPPPAPAASASSAEAAGPHAAGEVATDGAGPDAPAVAASISGSFSGGGDAQSPAILTESITVSESAADASESVLLTERKRAAQISDAIGSEEIGKIPGADAAGVLKRVTGISLQNNKYVYVRGLGDRYSQTTLNGAKIPSTEFERKVVPLDLFPTDLLDKITVSKSYTVDKPGDFAAGLVELVTKEFPPRQSLALGFGLSSNSETTGKDYFQYAGGLSFTGGGGQPLPASIPSDHLVPISPITGEGFTREELEAFGEQLVGAWGPATRGSAPMGGNFDATYGNTFGRLGLLVSATHDNDVSTTSEEQGYFVLDGTGGVRRSNDFIFDRTEERVRQALNANLALRLADNHQLQLRALRTTLSTDEARTQSGFFTDISSNIRDLRGRYQQQEIVNAQLTGNHFLVGAGQGAVFDWRVSYSDATTEENLRDALYEEQVRGSGEYVLTDNAQSGFLYFNDLDDKLTDTSANWESFLGSGRLQGSVKGGVAWTDNQRDFLGRRLRFRHRSTRGLDLSLPPEELFVPEFIGPNFELREVTRPTDTYTGDHEIAAAYVQTDLAWRKWRLIGGVRAEDSDQRVITLDRFTLGSPPIVSQVVHTDLLPSLSVVYQLRPSTNLRFSASQTVNRPEFRELAPFQFTHVVGGYAVTGNPDLDRAVIRSYDARWEWFPAGGEVVAASVFYKDFDQPIEAIQLAGAELLESFANVDSARNLGFELELRRNLGALIHESLKSFTVILNYSYIDSRITVDPDQTVLTNTSRPLVGQPDQVINASLEWARPESGTTVRLLVNEVGSQVARASSFGLPDVLEEARDTVDLVWRQGLDPWVHGLAIKLTGSNLTDAERRWTQGGQTFRLFDPGRGIGLSVSYKPF